MSHLLKLALLVLICASCQVIAGEETSVTMDDFLSALPSAEKLNVSASGLLDDTESIYHAQLVLLEGTYRTQQIFVFRSLSNGSFVLVDQSQKMDGMGGSGNWKVREIEINDHRLFVSFQYLWHGCSGEFTSQFQIRNGRLVMIGRESVEENINRNLVVRASANLLTGSAYTESGTQEAMYSSKGKLSSMGKLRFSVPNETSPFSEFDGKPWRSPRYAKRPVC